MIYITGDTHIPIDISKLNSKMFPAQKDLTKDDYLIICGDFGGVWNNSNEEHYWRKWFNNKNYTTLFIDGNHENFDLLKSFDIVDFRGGKTHKISDSIFHLMRGQIFEIQGKRLFTFGGASSHDKEFRKEGESWWKEELPSPEEIQTAYSNLDAVGWNVDYLITHCAPTSLQQILSPTYTHDVLTDFLEQIRSKLSYKGWYFGHYHQDQMIEEKHFSLFNDIKLI